MFSKLAIRALCVNTLFLLVAIQGSALAEEHEEESGDFALEEVTVTAERLERSILEVPVSVTSFDAETLEHYQVTNLKDLEVRVPGLQFGLDSPATIRGIGSLYRGVGGDVAVAQYSNDLYFDEPYGVVSSLYDMERVEVLRGPQGTLYGRNSIAGAINYVNKRPDPSAFDVGVLAEVAMFNGRRLNGFVNQPLSDAIALRLTAEWQEAEGNQENISGPDMGGRGDYNIAPQLRYADGPIDVNIRYARFEQDSASELRVPVRYPNTGVEFHINPEDGSPSEERNQFYLYPRIYPPAKDGSDDLKNVIDMNNGGTTDVLRDAVSIHASYDFSENLTGKYILGTSDLAFGLLDQDCDGSSVRGSAEDPYLSETAGRPFNDCTIRAKFDVRLTTHEFQLTFDSGNVSTLAGAYLFDQEIYNEYKLFNIANRAANVSSADAVPLQFIFGSDVFYPDESNPGVFINSHVADGSHQFIDVINERTVDSYAFYGQTSFSLHDQWQLTAGLRYTNDEKEVLTDSLWAVIDFEEENPLDDFVIPARFNEINPGQKEEFQKLTWNVSLEHSPDEDRLLYGRVATGYRAGGITPGAPDEYDSYDDEDLLSLELGYKADMFNDKLRMLVSGFVYNFENYQQPILVRQFSPFIYDLFVIDNLPDTSLTGVEIEGTWIVTDNFSLRGYYALQNSRLGEVYSSDPVNPNQRFETVSYTDPVTGLTRMGVVGEQFALKGNELPNMPRNKWSVSADWQRMLNSGATINWGVTYSFTGERFNRIFNIPNDRLDSYGRFDAMVGWRSANRKMSVSAFVENVLNDIGIMELESNGWDAGYYQDATLTDPRFAGVVWSWDY
ncbi:MAG: TonB-dependent receptor [Gammaproteobacteria bacterium]|nr:TonB-dependent receptor [Gammaproteobacteria bacterium]